MITAQLINIGRNNVCRQVTVKKTDDLVAEVSKHLMSRNIGLESTDEAGCHWQVFAGMQTVGNVQVLCGCGEKATLEDEGVYKCATCKAL